MAVRVAEEWLGICAGCEVSILDIGDEGRSRMTRLGDIRKSLGLTLLAGEDAPGPEVTGAYCGDMLSDVMANARPGELWITIQVHMNIIPVAVMKELAAIVIANGKRPDPQVLAKARQERVPLLGSALSSFQIACRLHEAGVKR